MKDRLLAGGFDPVPFGESADITVIKHMYCKPVRQIVNAGRSSEKRREQNKETFIVVTGCYAQLQPGEIAEIPGVDLVLGAEEKI